MYKSWKLEEGGWKLLSVIISNEHLVVKLKR